MSAGATSPKIKMAKDSETKSTTTNSFKKTDSKKLASPSLSKNPTVMERPTPTHAWVPGSAVSAKPAGTRRIAKPLDFQAGCTLFVRNRKGVCNRFEYPLVYWIFEGETIEKHRSCSADPEQFMVLDEPDTMSLQLGATPAITPSAGDTPHSAPLDNPFSLDISSPKEPKQEESLS
eukprot:gb/GEZN01014986.1/.p1 GENE.gb/GEZN01014986.1/~~gb/GEZN01014986.1/.p1  ORF type:complete len:176 (-),score=20.19 gb/GEZN01014986.1/:284-811(-)